MKKILLFILPFVLVFLAACNQSGETNQTTQTRPEKKNKAKYIISNNLLVDSSPFYMNAGKGRMQYFISQIKNTKANKIYQTINQTIQTDIENIIKKMQLESTDRIDFVASNPEFCANNLLSISIRSEYEVPSNGLLYNLTTGKRLTLKDLFVEGTDYVKLLNQMIPPAILKGERSEEDLLREPFTTVLPDQEFALTIDTLYIVFAKGQSGFAHRYAIGIPLAELDKHVDILEKYITTDLENSSNIKLNNIYITYKSTLTKIKNTSIHQRYPIISGLNSEFEKRINEVLRTEIESLTKKESKKIKNYDGPVMYGDSPLISITMYPTFNHYGILNLLVYVGYNFGENYNPYSKVLTFDLNHEKIIKSSDILISYFNRNKGFSNSLIELIKNRIQMDYNSNPEFVKEFNETFDYNMLINKAEILFNNYFLQDEVYFVVRLKDNVFKTNRSPIEVGITLKNNFPSSSQDLFNLN